MKRSFLALFSLALICSFALALPVQLKAETREAKRLEQGKITKNEAEHLVLKKYPGAKIDKCELKQHNQHSIWLVDLSQPGQSQHTRVQVDGETGAITSPKTEQH